MRLNCSDETYRRIEPIIEILRLHNDLQKRTTEVKREIHQLKNPVNPFDWWLKRALE